MDIYSQMEKIRKKIRLMSIMVIIPIVLAFILVIKAAMMLDSDKLYTMLLAAFAAGVCSVFFVHKKSQYNKKFQVMYKDNFLVGLLNEKFQNVQYDWKYGFSEDVVRGMGLVKMGSRFDSEDFISGEYNGVKFEQSEVTVEEVVYCDDRMDTYVHFKGRMFSFDYERKDIMSILIFSNNFSYSGEGFDYKYEKIKMENEGFNRSFKVKSGRAEDAFYVLTPHMMECIQDLKQRFSNIAIHYTPSKVYVAYKTDENAYDIDADMSVDLKREEAACRRDMQVIIDIIDALKIDSKR